MSSSPSITTAEIRATAGPIPDIEALTTLCNSALALPSGQQRWVQLLAVLPDRLPFDLLYLLYKRSYQDAPLPHLAYFPSDATIAESNAAAFSRFIGLNAGPDCFNAIYQYSIRDREAFWTKVIEFLSIKFDQAPSRVFDLGQGLARVRYLPGARLNIVTSCFQAPDSAVAIRFQKEGDGDDAALFEWSYATLEALTNRVAGALRSLGLQPGAAVAIFMQMTAESVAAYLGIIRAGMVAVSVADSFSADEVRVRLQLSDCRAVLTQDFAYRAGKRLPMYARVLAANWPQARAIVLPGEYSGAEAAGTPIQCELSGDGDLCWDDFLAKSDGDLFEPVSCPAEAPINILFSSGTTGTPKAIPWSHATAMKAAMDGCLHHDIKADECIVWPTNFGWMMAPWLVFATFMNRATIGLFYGSPVSPQFCAFVERSRTDLLGLIPSITKQLRHQNLLNGIIWQNVRRYSSTGESSAPIDQFWLMSQRKGFAPVIEYCGGTEIGGAYLSGSVTQPQAPSWFSTACPSIELFFIGDDDDEAEIALGGPSLGVSNSILNQDHFSVYFDGMPLMPNGEPMRRHGDRIRRQGGYYRAMGRADDTMNLGGIKVSSVQLEQVCSLCPSVDICAAVAVTPPDDGPDQLVVFTVVKGTGADLSTLRDAFQQLIRDHLSPLFKVHEVRIIDKMPMTATGKIMRRELRNQYRNQSKL